MYWKQLVDPFHNITLSAAVAVLPILFVFWALLVKKMKGYKASLLATALAIPIAIFIYQMPAGLALLSTAHGMLYGIFPICWIMITAVFLFNVTVKSGRFEIIKQFMASITPDRRLQALLIAFSFGSFLEGTAGFGSPVAITAAMLVGLGFDPLYAAGLCLIANTAPVAFGSIGIPVTVASQVTGIPEMAISQMVGRTLPFLSMLLPFYLVVLMAGFRKAMEVLPAILVSGLSFAFFQWFTSNFLGPTLPDIIAGVCSIVSLLVLLRYWKPKTIWRFPHESAVVAANETSHSAKTITKAWAPFMVLTVFVIVWGLKPVKSFLDSISLLSFPIPGLHNAIMLPEGDKLLPQVFKFNFLSAAGTAILFAAIVGVWLLGLSVKDGWKIFIQTLVQLKIPIVTIAAVLGFAYILNNSGITGTLSKVLSNTGVLFPFFAPVLGWLGVFVTGSDTSSNALFCHTQKTTAVSIGVDPVITVSANISGGVVGKMISPSSIAVAAAAGSMIGKESNLLRFTIKHSFIMLLFISMMTLAQAYWLKWIVP